MPTHSKKAALSVQNAEKDYKSAKLTQAQLQKQLEETTNQLKYNSAAWTEWGERASKAGKETAEIGKKLTMGIN